MLSNHVWTFTASWHGSLADDEQTSFSIDSMKTSPLKISRNGIAYPMWPTCMYAWKHGNNEKKLVHGYKQIINRRNKYKEIQI